MWIKYEPVRVIVEHAVSRKMAFREILTDLLPDEQLLYS